MDWRALAAGVDEIMDENWSDMLEIRPWTQNAGFTGPGPDPDRPVIPNVPGIPTSMSTNAAPGERPRTPASDQRFSINDDYLGDWGQGDRIWHAAESTEYEITYLQPDQPPGRHIVHCILVKDPT